MADADAVLRAVRFLFADENDDADDVLLSVKFLFLDENDLADEDEDILCSLGFLFFLLEDDLDGRICCFCQDVFSKNEIVYILPCSHVFHEDCFDVMLYRANPHSLGTVVVCCPYCNDPFLSTLLKYYTLARDALPPSPRRENAVQNAPNPAQIALQNPAALDNVDAVDVPPAGLEYAPGFEPEMLLCQVCGRGFEPQDRCVYGRNCVHLSHFNCYINHCPENICRCGVAILPDPQNLPCEILGEDGLPRASAWY